MEKTLTEKVPTALDGQKHDNLLKSALTPQQDQCILKGLETVRLVQVNFNTLIPEGADIEFFIGKRKICSEVAFLVFGCYIFF